MISLKQPALKISEGLEGLVAANAPLWAGEAEVIRSYFRSPERTLEGDLLWITRQMYKEYWDGFERPRAALNRELGGPEASMSRRAILELTRIMAEEYEHYCLFADVYESFMPEGCSLPTPSELKLAGSWVENDELMRKRSEHRQRHGSIGTRAQMFTEGGYCTLYSEGMKLRANGGIDDAIAAACSRVYEDEFEHMLLGIIGMDEEGMERADWQLLAELTAEQCRLRIRMRNAQFGFTVPEERMRQICAGECEPVAFDYARACRRAEI